MKRITKLKELEDAIERIKNQEKVDSNIIHKLRLELEEEEKISRNFLQITQNGIFQKNIKKALKWNEKVMDLKNELNSLIKAY